MTTLEVNVAASGAEVVLNVQPADVLEVNVGTSGASGVTAHGDLTGRSVDNQHPASAITAPGGADMLQNADAVALFETIAAGLSAARLEADRVSASLPFVVTDAGATIAGTTVNTSLLTSYTLALLSGSTAEHRIANILRIRDELTAGPVAYAECGLGPLGYSTPDIDAARGYWRCQTLNPSPTSSMRIRVLARCLTGSRDAAGYQEWHSEPGDSAGVAGEGGSIDRFEYAQELAEAISDFFECGEVAGDPEIQFSARGCIPPGPWVEREVHVDFTAQTVAFRVRSDIAFDYTDPDDDSTWITLRTATNGPATLAASNSAVEQWIGRGDGRFDIARVQKWHDGTLVMDADFQGAADGATAIDDAVLESSPGVPAVWTAQLNAVVGVPDAAGGAVDSVNGATGTVVLDQDDIASGTTNKAFTATEQTKLAGIATAATANSADATLLARANHTGTQLLSTISDAGTLAGLSAVASANITDGTIVAGDLAASVSGRIPTTVQIGSDVGVTSSTVLTNTTGLSFAAVNGTTYYIDAWLMVTGDSAGDLKIGVTCPTGTLAISVAGVGQASSSIGQAAVTTDAVIVASGGSATLLGTVTGATSALALKGYFTATADGTFQIQHAQRISNGTATTVKAGSWMRYHT